MNALSRDWDDITYTLALLLLAWIAPMAIIIYCNIGIVNNNKTNNKEIISIMNKRKVNLSPTEIQLRRQLMICEIIP